MYTGCELIALFPSHVCRSLPQGECVRWWEDASVVNMPRVLTPLTQDHILHGAICITLSKHILFRYLLVSFVCIIAILLLSPFVNYV